MTVRKGMGASTKRTYDSLFRHRSLPDGRRVWHIHGEANQPASILLGFKHDTNSVQSLDRYLEWVNPRQEQHNRGRLWNHKDARSPCRNAASALNRRVVAASEEQWSWVDHFLTSTVHVLGLELDTSETLLWRLLMYRHQMLAKGRTWHTTQQVSPPIHFYTPPATTNRQKAHRTLLEAFGIELQANGEFDYRTFYEQALDHIEAELASGRPPGAAMRAVPAQRISARRGLGKAGSRQGGSSTNRGRRPPAGDGRCLPDIAG